MQNKLSDLTTKRIININGCQINDRQHLTQILA